MIFETDMGNDVDDVLALDMIFKYADGGEVNLLGIGINKEGICSAEFTDIMRTWYGYPDIPIGFIREGAECDHAVNYAEVVCGMKDEGGEPLFARTAEGYEDFPEVPELYRRLLAAQPDNSVTMVSVGFSTNLAALLDTPADEISPLTGKELVAAKVRLLSVMGGDMADSDYCEYNIVKDIPAAQKVFSEWPTLIVVSPFELGSTIKYPAESIENDFGWAADGHPAVEAYKCYRPMPYNQKTWDLTSVLYAVEGDSHFTVSPLGNIEVTDEGGTIFTADPQGNRQWLSVDDAQREEILGRMRELITTRPKCRQ